jgi:predicted dehydrogenase
MALTEEECRLMIAAADASGVLCAVLHCMHWSPALLAARASLASGALPPPPPPDPPTPPSPLPPPF